MRIAQVSTLSAPVRRETGGSVESLIWLLARELVRLGHEVTVFGAAGSEVDGELVATLPGPYGAAGSPDDWQLCEWVNLCRAVEQSQRFDVMHSHAYLWGLPLEPFARCPLVHTMHIVPDDNSAQLWMMKPGSCVTALSRPISRGFRAGTVGVDALRHTRRRDEPWRGAGNHRSRRHGLPCGHGRGVSQGNHGMPETRSRAGASTGRSAFLGAADGAGLR